MNHGPTRSRAPSVGEASDEEFLRAVHRAERAAPLPSAAKMQELTERLEPVLRGATAKTISWRWPVVLAVASMLVAATLAFQARFDAPALEAQAAPPPELSALEPPLASPIGAPPGISVAALPAASAPPRARKPAILSACTGEIELLDRADGALRGGDPTRALTLAAEHTERCPSGAFVQERERIAIEALARQGRADEVRERARPFLKRFPSSPHARRIRSLAGESE